MMYETMTMMMMMMMMMMIERMMTVMLSIELPLQEVPHVRFWTVELPLPIPSIVVFTIHPVRVKLPLVSVKCRRCYILDRVNIHQNIMWVFTHDQHLGSC